jgi:hypothetical protein
MATCPNCGVSSRDDSLAIEVTRVLEALPLGTYSVAGVTPKVVARERYKMACLRCGWSILGWIEDGYFCAYKPEDNSSEPRTD